MELHVKERKKGESCDNFLSPPNSKPPYYAKVLLTHGHWIKDKVQLKNLAIGSNCFMTNHKIFLQSSITSHVISSRASRRTKLTKTENLRKERLSLIISKTYRRIFFRDCNFLPHLGKLFSGHILTRTDI